MKLIQCRKNYFINRMNDTIAGLNIGYDDVAHPSICICDRGIFSIQFYGTSQRGHCTTHKICCAHICPCDNMKVQCRF